MGQIPALPLTFQDIKLATKCDATLSRVRDYVKKGWPKEVPNNVQPYVQRQTELSVENDCLLWETRVVIPKSLQDTRDKYNFRKVVRQYVRSLTGMV